MAPAEPLLSRRAVLAMAASACSLWTSAVLAAEPTSFVVIVHPDNPLRRASRELLTDLFLKRVTRWKHGPAVRPVDLYAASPVREHFSEQVLRRSVAVVKRYWQQRIFSGRGVPPPELASEAEVIAFVLGDTRAVGYVSTSAVLQGTQVLAIEGV